MGVCLPLCHVDFSLSLGIPHVLHVLSLSMVLFLLLSSFLCLGVEKCDYLAAPRLWILVGY